MALKDWKKKGRYLYENERIKKAIYLTYEPMQRFYRYEVGNIIGVTRRFRRISTINSIKLKEAKTKTLALKFAKNYMRRH